MCSKKKLPSDYKILNTIFKTYQYDFINYDNLPNKHKSKNLVPIDCNKIAEQLQTDGEIIFGRLHYFLSQKYQQLDENGEKLQLFYTFMANGEKHCIHFSYLTSVLAEMREERKARLSSMVFAGISAFAAFLSAIFAIASKY